MLQTCAGMDTLHSGRRSSACTSDRSRAGPKPVATSTRSVILPCGLRDLEPGRDRPASSPGPKEKRRPVAGVMCVTRAPHGSTAGVALQRVWGRSKYEFERPHGRSGPVTPPDLTRLRRSHRVVTRGSQRVTPPGEARLPARSRLPLRFGVAQFLLARRSPWQVRVSRRLPDVESSLLRVNLDTATGARRSVRASDVGDQIGLIVAVGHRAVGALQSIEPSPQRGRASPRHPDQACSMRSSPSRLLR